MNATTVNERLLAGDKVMPEMYLKQSGFTYSARRSFTENKKKKKNGDSIYICQNELDKTCFLDMILLTGVLKN